MSVKQHFTCYKPVTILDFGTLSPGEFLAYLFIGCFNDHDIVDANMLLVSKCYYSVVIANLLTDL